MPKDPYCEVHQYLMGDGRCTCTKPPKIPPNSKHFDGDYFKLECGEIVCLVDTARWRSIIAAVAERDWQLEANRRLEAVHRVRGNWKNACETYGAEKAREIISDEVSKIDWPEAHKAVAEWHDYGSHA